MALDSNNINFTRTLSKVFDILRLKKKEIFAIYFFALMYGLLQLTIPLGIQSIVNFILAYTFSTSLWLLIALVVLGVAISGGLQVTQMKIIERVNQKIFTRFSLEYTHHIPRIDMKSVDQEYLPEMVNRFFDTVSLQKGLTKFFLDIPVASIQIVFGLILLSFYSYFFIVFGLLLLIVIIILMYVTSKKGLSTSIEESDCKYGVASWLEEMARSVKTFKYSAGTALHLKKSDELLSGYLNVRTEHFNVLLIQYWALIFFKVFTTAFMLGVGAYLAINNLINIGQFVAAEIVIIMIMNSVEKFIFNLDNIYDTLTSVEKLSKLLEKPEEKSGNIAFPVSPIGPAIKVSELSFSFDGKNNILQDISFSIPKGSTVCIRGEEGSGKSILLRLLSGSYSDFAGSVSIENVPVNNYDLKSLRKNTCIILNEQEIFDGTLIENITLGSEDISFNHLNELTTRFGFQHSFNALPGGYETRLDATGRRLSKSLAQKILLLRALVHNSSLLLLEDPWSVLKDSSKKQVQDYLLNHTTATVVVATNDLAFAARCNYVIELNEGKLVNAGTAKEVFGVG